ncbi:ATP-binding protein [Nitrospira sp. Nam74]
MPDVEVRGLALYGTSAAHEVARMNPAQLERLRDQLTRLRLLKSRERLEALHQDAATHERSYADFLDQVLGEEVADKAAKTMRTSLARFPFVKSLEAFDFAYQPSLDKKQVQQLASCHFIGHGENLVILGPPRVGKSHCDNWSSMAHERKRCQAASHRNEITPRLIGAFRKRRCLCFGYVSHPKGCRP